MRGTARRGDRESQCYASTGHGGLGPEGAGREVYRAVAGVQQERAAIQL